MNPAYVYKRRAVPILRVLWLWNEGYSQREIATIIKMSTAGLGDVIRDLGLTRGKIAASAIRLDRASTRNKRKCRLCNEPYYARGFCKIHYREQLQKQRLT